MNQGEMSFSIDAAYKAHRFEGAKGSVDAAGSFALNHALQLHAMADDVGDGDELQAELLAKFD